MYSDHSVGIKLNSEKQYGRLVRVFPNSSSNDLYLKSFSDLITLSPTKKNESIIQQNRILINYKKLRHFENSFLRNKNKLKKNFDVIFSQMNSADVDSKSQRKNNEFFATLLSSNGKKDIRKIFKLSKSADRLENQTKKKLQKNISKFSKINKCDLSNTKSNLESSLNSRNKLVCKALSKKNKMLFDTYENINRNTVEFHSPKKFQELATLNKPSQNFEGKTYNFILKNICFYYPSLLEKNFIFRQHIDFNKSMIQLTLCLHKILAHIEKVRNI